MPMRLSLDPASLPPSLDTPLVRRLLQIIQPFRHLIPFALVGITGLVVNSAVLWLATEVGHIYYLVSAALATLCSTTWNFTLTEVWVFRDRRRPGWLLRLAMFFIMNNAALLLRGPILYGLTTGLNVHYLISNLVSITVMTLIRYLFSDKFIWRPARKPATGPSPAQEKDLG